MEPVFVYGSLREGMHNNWYLEEAQLVQTGHIQGFDMYQLNTFPAIVPGSGVVVGEVYQVSKATLAVLDRLEGHPNVYKREKVTVTLTEGEPVTAWVYVWQRPVNHLIPVLSGDWVEYYAVKSI